MKKILVDKKVTKGINLTYKTERDNPQIEPKAHSFPSMNLSCGSSDLCWKNNLI